MMISAPPSPSASLAAHTLLPHRMSAFFQGSKHALPRPWPTAWISQARHASCFGSEYHRCGAAQILHIWRSQMRHYYGSIYGERQAWELGSLPTGYGGASLLSVAAPFLLAGGRSLPRIRLVLPPS